jgi:hypothetical protein
MLSTLCCYPFSTATTHPCHLFFITRRIDQNLLEAIPIVPELTWYPLDPLLLLGIHIISPTNIELALYNK